VPRDAAYLTLEQLIEARRIGHELCFLCGADLDTENRSDEHVFPKWLQRRHNLANQKLTLLNGSSIKYRQMKIPCCRTCNGIWLSKVENRVKSASKSPTRWRELADDDLFRWASKIMYGNIYREAFLAMDQADPAAGMIVDEEFVHELRTVHLFLQGVRAPIEFQHFRQGSIFRAELVDPDPDHPDEHFWFYDNPFRLLLAMRTGPVGAIVALQDNGVIAEIFQPVNDTLANQKLTHMQFMELAAQLAYIRVSLNRTAKYVMVQGAESIQVIPLPLAGMSGLPLFEEAMLSSYATLLSHMTGWPLEEVMPGDDQVISFFEPGKQIYPLAGLMNPTSGLFRARSDTGS